MRPYNLTPLGPGWGWGYRVLEIVGQTIALIFVTPIVALHNATGWIMSKILP